VTSHETAPPVVCVFAGLDPTGGAGLLADAATLTALGAHAAGIATLLSGQDLEGVRWWQPVSAQELRAQATPLLRALPIRAWKIGAVGSAANAAAIAELLDQTELPVVLDPVLASERGDALGDEEMLAALRRDLVPLATIVTPNAGEARRLAGLPATASLDDAAAALLAAGTRAVLITGEHEVGGSAKGGDLTDRLWRREDARPLTWHVPKLPYAVHGSGCLFATAIAARFAFGMELLPALEQARAVSRRAWAGAWIAGRGQRLPARPMLPHERT
jgi:hydroxymethylpyrimidine/phosphomethylpyrimidine kinase